MTWWRSVGVAERMRVSHHTVNWVLLCWLAFAPMVTACGSNVAPPAPVSSSVPESRGKPPAEPAIAGAPTAVPPGRVVAIGPAPEGIAIGRSGIGAVAVRNPDGVELFDAATGVVRRMVPTAGAARHLSLAGSDGPVLVPLEGSNELVQLDLTEGTVLETATGVGHQPHDAAQTTEGTIVVTNELGGGVVFVRDGKVIGSAPAGPVQPGGIAAVGHYAVVADVQGNGVWVYDPSTRQLVSHGPVGVKLTHAVGLSADLVAFADTDGGAVFVERVDPKVTQVARIDGPGSPYGLAYDAHRARLYVTLTASNLLRVIDLSDVTKPRIVGDIATVQQPNSVAVNPRSDDVLITGLGPTGGGSIQIVPADLLPAG